MDAEDAPAATDMDAEDASTPRTSKRDRKSKKDRRVRDKDKKRDRSKSRSRSRRLGGCGGRDKKSYS
jgi:hypothetical protein